jgi:hypothetical protein
MILVNAEWQMPNAKKMGGPISQAARSNLQPAVFDFRR